MTKFFWIFDYDAALALVPLSAALFMLGGGGVNPVRRIGIAGLVFLCGIYYQVETLRVLLSTTAMAAVLTVPYGDSLKKHVGEKITLVHYLIGALYGLAVVPLSHHWLAVLVCPAVTGLFFGTLIFTSQRFDYPSHKWVEMFSGGSIGYALCYSLQYALGGKL